MIQTHLAIGLQRLLDETSYAYLPGDLRPKISEVPDGIKWNLLNLKVMQKP